MYTLWLPADDNGCKKKKTYISQIISSRFYVGWFDFQCQKSRHSFESNIRRLEEVEMIAEARDGWKI